MIPLDQLSEWVLFQLECEYRYRNMPRRKLREVLQGFNKYLTTSPDPDKSRFELMRSFCRHLTSLPRLQIRRDPYKATYLLHFTSFESFVMKWEEKKEGRKLDLKVERIRLRDIFSAQRVSAELAKIGMKCGSERKHRDICWLACTEFRTPEDFYGVPEPSLASLARKCGLPWEATESLPLELVAILVPSDLLLAKGTFLVPTMFHAASAYFKPNRDARNMWGRALDLDAHDYDLGLPEAIHKSIRWNKSFLPRLLGPFTSGFRAFENRDWSILLNNEWNREANWCP